MSTLDHAEHAAGILSLVVIAVIAGSGVLAVSVIARSIIPQAGRIWRLACGHIEIPAASVARPTRDGTPQLRADEAAAEPALQVRA